MVVILYQKDGLERFEDLDFFVPFVVTCTSTMNKDTLSL